MPCAQPDIVFAVRRGIAVEAQSGSQLLNDGGSLLDGGLDPFDEFRERQVAVDRDA